MAENDDVDTKPNMFAISSRDLFRLKRKRTEDEDLLDDKHRNFLAALYMPELLGFEWESTGSLRESTGSLQPAASDVIVLDELCGPETKNTGSSLNKNLDVLPPASEVSVLDELCGPETKNTGSSLNDDLDVLPPASEVSVLDATELSEPKTKSTVSPLNDEPDVLPPASEVSVLDELSGPKTNNTGSPLNDEHDVLPPAASEVSVLDSSSFVPVSSRLCQKQEYLVSLVIAIHKKLGAHLSKLIDNSARPRIVSQVSAIWYKELLNDIHRAIRFQQYTTQHLSDFFSVETAASSESVDKVDKDPNSRKYQKRYSHLGIGKLKEKHQNLLNLNRDLVARLAVLQEHFKTPQSNGTNLISRTLNSTSAISRYHELVNDLECSWKCTEEAAWYFFAFPMGASGVVESPPTDKKPVRVSCGVGVGFAKGFTMYSSTNEFSKLSLDSRVGF